MSVTVSQLAENNTAVGLSNLRGRIRLLHTTMSTAEPVPNGPSVVEAKVEIARGKKQAADAAFRAGNLQQGISRRSCLSDSFFLTFVNVLH